MNTNATPRPKPTAPKKVENDLSKIEENTKLNVVVSEGALKEKPKFVRKPHLTDRPFMAHEGLQALQKQMETKTPRRGQRRTKKETK